MTTTFDCALGGVLLSSLDESIAVLTIREDAPKMRISTAVPWHEGLHLLGSQRERLTVHVIFAIHEPNPTRRRQVLQTIHTWAAKGGTLATSDRPDQQLTVICSGFPAVDADDWMAPLTLTFTTTNIPYWENASITQAVCTSEATLAVPGTADAVPVSVMVVNYGDTALTSLTLVCGSTQMTFENISVPANSMFVLTQVGPVVKAFIGEQSVLHCRTAESDDSLLAPCGQVCPIQVIADQDVNSIFMARGRYV